MTGGLVWNIVLIVALMLLNAFFAAAEIALVSARRVRLRELAAAGNSAARVALRLTENPAHFLSTVQIGITMAGFFASAIGALSLVAVLAEVLAHLPGPLAGAANGLALVVVTVLLSFVSLILGELTPKALAAEAADSVALAVARPIALLARLMAPIVALLTGLTNLVLWLTGTRRRAQFPSVSQEELLAMVEAGKDEGVIDPAEAAMTEGVFGLHDRRASELMVPRVDVIALPASATVADARRLFIGRGHSRMPVYEGDLDHIVGVLHMKDLLSLTGPAVEERQIGPLARPPLYVPEGQLASALLRQLQRARRHLAIVIDEHGGTAGIITLEDILEEIVGEIADEYDPESQEPITRLSPDEVVMSGGLPIADLNDALDLKLGEPGVDTVGGLVVAHLGRFARVGDVVEFPDCRVEVLAVDRNRIRRLRATRTARRPLWEDGDS